MNKKKSIYVLPFAVLLFLSLITTASTVGTRVDAESLNSTQQLTVYIESMKSSGAHTTLVADEIDWYQGESANQVFAQREPEAYAEIGGVPDDYYIVNDSETLTTLQVADNAVVTMQIYDHTGKAEDLDIQWNEKITLQQFADQLANKEVVDLTGFPYHITLQNGVVTSIVQQYTP